MQSLAHTKPLVRHFINMSEVFPNAPVLAPSSTGGAAAFCGNMTCALWLFYAQFYQQPVDSLNPIILMREIAKNARRFRGNDQQDAQEVLRYLQDISRDEFLSHEKKQREAKEAKEAEKEENGEAEEQEQQQQEQKSKNATKDSDKQEANNTEEQDFTPKSLETKVYSNLIDKSFNSVLCSTVICQHCGKVCSETF